MCACAYKKERDRVGESFESLDDRFADCVGKISRSNFDKISIGMKTFF